MYEIKTSEGSHRYRLPERFIQGIRSCREGPVILGSLQVYARDLENFGISLDEAQTMIDKVAEYSTRKFTTHGNIGGLLPLFQGLVDLPEAHNTIQKLEESISRFSFAAELNGVF